MRRLLQSGRSDNIFNKGKERNTWTHSSASVYSRKTVGLSSWKGQWFLISAVIVSGIFITVSFLLKDYFIVPAVVANEEHIYLDDIKNGSIRTIQIDCAKGGGVLTNKENLTEFIDFAGQRFAALGYAINITPKSSIDCTKGVENFHVIILKSNKADVWEGQRPEIDSISNIMFGGDMLISYRIQFKNAVNYDFIINASVYNSTGFINSRTDIVSAGSTSIMLVWAPLGINVPQSPGMYTVINSIHLIGKKRWELA